VLCHHLRAKKEKKFFNLVSRFIVGSPSIACTYRKYILFILNQNSYKFPFVFLYQDSKCPSCQKKKKKLHMKQL